MEKINFSFHGCSAKFLGPHEIIEKGDFIRDIVSTSCEHNGFDTTFYNDDWCGQKWHKVEDDFTFWIGKTYFDFMQFAKIEKAMHEIVRVNN